MTAFTPASAGGQRLGLEDVALDELDLPRERQLRGLVGMAHQQPHALAQAQQLGHDFLTNKAVPSGDKDHGAARLESMGGDASPFAFPTAKSGPNLMH